MKDHSLGTIGKRIKEVRKKKNLSLKQVAENSGVTAGLISRIENFRTIPSIPVLHQISQSLGVSMSELVFEVSTSEEKPLYYIVREKDWVDEEREDSAGMVYNSILSKACEGNLIKVNMVTILPQTERPAVINDATEIIHVLEGKVKYSFPGSEVILAAGDTIYFDGRHPHSIINLFDEMSRLFVIYILDSNE